MPRLLRAYTIVISGIGGAIVLWALFHLPIDWPGLLMLAGLAVLAEWTNTELFPGSRSRVSVAAIVALASMLLLGPLAGVLTHAASGLTTALTTTLQKAALDQKGRASLLQRTAFNVGMLVISIAVAGTVYTTAGGTVGQVARETSFVPLLLAVIADHVVNVSLLVGVIALQTRNSPLQVWREHFMWTAPIATMGAVIGSAVLALGYQHFRFYGLAFFLLPGLLIRYCYGLYVGTRRHLAAAAQRTNAELRDMADTLLRSQLMLADLISAVGDGRSEANYQQIAQQARSVKEELATEDRRIQELQKDLAQVIR